MRRPFWLVAALLAFLAAPLPAQDREGGATVLERLIQNALSDGAREVSIRGFRGALSGRASLEELTVADAEGVWLRLTDATLDWNRAALFRGRLVVREISAASIEMPRRPVPDPDALPSPEASGMPLRLPELPVAVIVDAISAEQVALGEDVAGQALTLGLSGRLRLDGGEGEAVLAAERLDATEGTFDIDAAFSNETRDLALALVFQEAAGGVVAGALGIPGAPPLTLAIEGSGPVDDFNADLALATEGRERFSGTVSTAAGPSGERRFAAAFDGDLRPLVEPEFHSFFGASAEVRVSGRTGPDGTAIEGFRLATRTLDLGGEIRIGPGGLPRLIDVVGRLADPDGSAVVLPVGGGDTRVGSADFDISFDAAEGQGWTGHIALSDLERPDLRAARVVLDGRGRIARAPAEVEAAFDFAASALDLGDPDARRALGESVSGRAEIGWREGAPIRVDRLSLDGESYALSAEGTIADLTSSLALAGTASVEAEALERFSGIAGRPLSGALTARLSGRGEIFTGLIDLDLAVEGRDLGVGDPRIDPYLTGMTSIEAAAARTTAGIFLERFTLSGRAAEAEAKVALTSRAGLVDLSARLGDIAPLADGLSGPAELILAAISTDGLWNYAADFSAMAARLSATGTLQDALSAPSVTFEGRLESDDLSRLSALAGRPVSGQAAVDFTGRADSDLDPFRLAVSGRTVDLTLGQRDLDALLGGRGDIAFDLTRSDERLELSRLSVSTPAARVDGTLLLQDGTPAGSGRVALDVSLPDIAVLVPEFSGRVRLDLDANRGGSRDPWRIALDATAPGLDAAAEGELAGLPERPDFSGRLTASAADLAPYADLIGRPVRGAFEAAAEGRITADLEVVDLRVEASGRNLGLGQPDIDRLLAGTATLDFDGRRDGARLEVRSFDFTTPLVTARASGAIGDGAPLTFDARLADLGPFVPALPGVVTATGRAALRQDGTIAIDATGTGPGGASVAVDGTVDQDARTVAAAIIGRAPLALANRAIAPRAVLGSADFDLRIDGPPGLDSLSGRISTADARLIAPLLDLAVDGVNGNVSIARGTASLDIAGRPREGGEVGLSGTVGLRPPLPASLDLALRDVRLVDPALFTTTVNGALGVDGPLTGGAEIAGRLALGTTEIRIPSGTGVSRAGLPDIRHVGEPADVRETRARAGVIDREARREAGADGRAFPIDIVIDASNQIFVRGRGLDAELGGGLRVTGTTANVIPIGEIGLIRGRLDILGQRLTLSEGQIRLAGRFDPRIRLAAETETDDVVVRIVIEGEVSAPEIRFESTPELPEDEVLSRLLFGRGIDTLSPLQVAQLASAAATLAGQGGGGVIERLRESTGLSDLDVTSDEEGGAAVRLGAYVSENIYTDVEVGTSGDARIQLNLDLNRSLRLRGSATNDGETGIGLFFERDY